MTAVARFRRLLADWLFSWRDWFTFLIVLLAFLSVVGSIDGAHLVDGMPSLYPIALAGLLLGFFLARLSWREWLIHLVALLLGAAALLGQVLAVTPGDGLEERAGEMVQRVHLWLEALFNGGISSDNLPVIVIIVVLTWIAAYLSSWSIFRWNNPWLGLVPGGLALLINMSYLSKQFSASFVVFLLGAVLLVARMHFSQSMKQWRRIGASYPRSLHLSSINQAFWAALLLLGIAWLIPVPGQARALQSVWDGWAQPVADEFASLSRVFTAVEGKRGLPLSRTDSILPFHGSFGTAGGPIMSVKGSQPAFLRALVYDVYVSHGWKMSDRSQQPSTERSQELSRLLDLAEQQHQVPATVEIEVAQGLPVFVAPGQPLGVDVPAQVETAADPLDVTSLRPVDSLKEGDRYTAVGLVSTAPPDLLAASGSDYPSWVTERYLQLPEELPKSVAALARDITRYDDTPYEKASSIQDYLRRYPVDLEESAPPGGRDAVEYFLFERQRGHPLYHSSAMVVLLRTLGIPARLAAGFIIYPGAGAAGAEGISQVGAEDASAWPEVYFPGFGWIQFSPAPIQPLTSGLVGNISQGSTDTYSMEDLLGLSLPPAPNGAAPPTPQQGSAAATTGDGLALRLALLCVSTVLALSIVSALGVRYAWNRGLAGLTYPAQLWEKTRRLSSWAGMKSQPSQTPREFATRLQQELPDVADLSFLVRAYERVEFGRGQLEDEERPRLASLWKTLRSRLLRRLLRRR